jgi:hypothetical protein
MEESDDNSTWRTVAGGEGRAVTTVNFPILQARYVKATLNKASGTWWSIAEMRVFAEESRRAVVVLSDRRRPDRTTILAPALRTAPVGGKGADPALPGRRGGEGRAPAVRTATACRCCAEP